MSDIPSITVEYSVEHARRSPQHHPYHLAVTSTKPHCIDRTVPNNYFSRSWSPERLPPLRLLPSSSHVLRVRTAGHSCERIPERQFPLPLSHLLLHTMESTIRGTDYGSVLWKRVILERAVGIEPASSGWKPEVIAIIRCPHRRHTTRSSSIHSQKHIHQ